MPVCPRGKGVWVDWRALPGGGGWGGGRSGSGDTLPNTGGNPTLRGDRPESGAVPPKEGAMVTANRLYSLVYIAVHSSSSGSGT